MINLILKGLFMKEILMRIVSALFSKQKIGAYVVGGVLALTAVGLEISPDELKTAICSEK